MFGLHRGTHRALTGLSAPSGSRVARAVVGCVLGAMAVASISVQPAAAQPVVAQGSVVVVEGGGKCTVGFSDPAHQRSLIAAHCGREGGRVAIVDPATGASSGPIGTFFRSKVFDSRLGNDWAAIQWDPGVAIGGNGYSGNGWVHPNDIALGEPVCYHGNTSHGGGGETCGKFAGSVGNTFFVDAPLTRAGDSGGPVWVPGRGFVGVISSQWAARQLPVVGGANFVVGVVPSDGPSVSQTQLMGLYMENLAAPVSRGGSSVGPAGELLRRAVSTVFGVFSRFGLPEPASVHYA